MVSSSPSREALIHCVSARTPRCLSGSSGGAYSSEWLPRMTRSSVDPDRGAEKMNTGAVSSRPPPAAGSFQARSASGRDSWYPVARTSTVLNITGGGIRQARSASGRDS